MSTEYPVRSLDYILELRQAFLSICESETDSNLLQVFLVECHSDIQGLLKPSSRDTLARDKIQSGTIVLNETECSINKEFIDSALKLADCFDINEFSAAQYVYIGTQTSTRYDREPYDSAVYNYLSGLGIMYELIDSIISLASDNKFHESYVHVVKEFLHSHESEGKHFQDLLHERMQSIQARISSLLESEKNTRILHSGFLEHDRGFVLRSLLEQHESVCATSAAICKIEPCKNSMIPKVMSSLKESEHWNPLGAHQFLFLIRAIQYCSSAVISQSHDQPLTPEKATVLYKKMIQELRNNKGWKCKSMCAALQLIVGTELLSVCNNSEEVAMEYDYEQDILSIVNAAISGNAFQHLITFKLFLQKDVLKKHPFSLFFSNDALAQYNVFDVETRSLQSYVMLEECLRNLCVSFIVNFADVLKELRLAAEDNMLSQEVGDGASTDHEDHSENLFYGLIYTAFLSGSDTAYIFWQDKTSNLYGFLTWASNAEVPSTIYAYFEMISALTLGPQCSKAAAEFFDYDDLSSRVSNALTPSSNTSWRFIFSSLQYYCQQLDRKNDAQDYQDILELDRHNALILEAYLMSISSILINVKDLKLGSHLNSKFDAITVLFKLLACRLPVELYSAILRLLGVMSRTPDLRHVIWQYFEAWLGSIRPETHAVLGSVTTRQRQLEHRPLTSLTAFSTCSVESTVELISCLTSMLTPHHDVPGSLAFPQSLGDNSRYPGASDYVDFIWDCLLASQAPDASLTAIQRVTMTLVCISCLERCISTLELELIDLTRMGIVDAMQVIPIPLVQYFNLHPGTRVLQQIGVLKHRQALIQIIKSHDTADKSIKALLIPVVETTLRLISHILTRTETFDEFVEPIARTKVPRTGSLAQDVSRDTDFVVHLCMLASSRGNSYEEEALSLLSLCESLKLLDSRHFMMLASVDESKSILLGFISMVESQTPGAESDALRLLHMLVADLEDRTNRRISPSLAHFILGFSSDSAYNELNLGIEPGHIGSGRSMIHTLLELLSQSTQPHEIESYKTSELLDQASIILLLLCEDEKTSKIVGPILQEAQFLQIQLRRQGTLQLSTDIYAFNKDLCAEGLDPMQSSIVRRATAIKYFSFEILSCYVSDQRSTIQEYTAAFLPPLGNENKSGIVLCDFLDILSLDTKMPMARSVWSYFAPDLYFKLLHDNNSESSHKLDLALALQKASRLRKADEREVALINAEHAALVDHLSAYKHLSLRKEAIRNCLTEWSKLVVVVFHTLLKDVPYAKIVARELVHVVLVQLPDIQENDHELADTLSEAVLTIMQFTDETKIEQLMHFFKSILICLQSPASTQHQRECLYLAGAWCLQVIDAHRQDRSTRSSMSSIAKAGMDRYLTIICRDTVVHEAVVRISACVFLDLLLRTCEQLHNPILSQRIVSLNLFARFAHHFEISLNTDVQMDAIDRQFDIVLRLAMTRPGAQELAQTPALLNALAKKYFTLIDGAEDASNAIRLLRVYVACVVSLGAQLSIVQTLLANFASTWIEKLLSHAQRMKNAKNTKVEEFQDLLEVLDSSRQQNGTS